MANQEHVDLLLCSVEEWNQWRKDHPDILPDLSNADLSYRDLSGANLSNTYLSGANLISSNLRQALLDEARLNRANFNHADLGNATIQLADLSSTNLQNANLNSVKLNNSNLFGTYLNHANMHNTELLGVHFHGADLSGTNLQNAMMYQTTFSNVDLRSVKGLESIEHEGPSNIATSTLERSEGDISEIFLRGAGLSDTLITYTRSLILFPIQYHTCFISYASQDCHLVARLYNDLQAHGVRCWFAPEDMKTGDKIRSRIDEAIHLYEKLLLLLSQHSLSSSWVEQEVEAALEKEARQQREVLFPIRLDEAVMQTKEAWAASVRRTRHIGDFAQWKDHDAYQTAFKRLLDDLEKTNEQKGQERKT